MTKSPEQTYNRQPDIDTILNLDKLGERAYKPQDILGIPVIYIDSTMKSGRNGDYLVIDLKVESSGEDIKVSTGAAHVMSVVKALRSNGTRNVRFAFGLDGQRIIITKAPTL